MIGLLAVQGRIPRPIALIADHPPAGLTVRLAQLDQHPLAGNDVGFRVRWSDGAGRYSGLSEDWGDGTATSSVQVATCHGWAGAHHGEQTLTHRYRSSGRYRLVVGITTVGCSGQTETRTAAITVVVGAATRGVRNVR